VSACVELAGRNEDVCPVTFNRAPLTIFFKTYSLPNTKSIP
jgi:hypothetical protein